MSLQHAVDQYRTNHVETVSKERLVVMLYEGALRFMDEAQQAIAGGDIPRRGNQINRALSIVQELNNSLDHGVAPDLTRQLAALYEYVEFELSEANRLNESRHIGNAARVLRTLLNSWKRVETRSAEGPQEKAKAEPSPAGAGPSDAPRLSLSV